MASTEFNTPTVRKRLYMQQLPDVIAGKISRRQAAQRAGFSDTTAISRIETPQLKAQFSRLMRRFVPMHKIAQRVSEGVDATKTIGVEMKATEEGGKPKISTTQIEVPDFRERREYIKLVGEWGYDMVGDDKTSGFTLNNQTNINMPVVNVNFADAPRAKELNGNSDDGSAT
jgi:hypothetical protein